MMLQQKRMELDTLKPLGVKLENFETLRGGGGVKLEKTEFCYIRLAKSEGKKAILLHKIRKI